MCAFENEEIVASNELTFKCIKCGEETEYSEFSEAIDPKYDYGYYLMDTLHEPIGLKIAYGVDLCELCVRGISIGRYDK